MKRGFVNNLAESLKDLKLKNTTTKPSCGLRSEGTSFRELLSDVMSMKKADWNEILEDLIGSQQKLCNVDTTVATNDPHIISNESTSDDESHHDFYLI